MACLGDKDVDGAARTRARLGRGRVHREHVAALPARRGTGGKARAILGEERVHLAETLPGAVELAVELAEDPTEGDTVSGGGILITGSVVTAGEARTLFGKDPA